MKALKVAVALILLAPLAASALGPHEILLVVNENSVRSRAVASHYVKVRGVPQCNVVKVRIPKASYDPGPAISHNDFTKHIWRPCLKAMVERGIGDHVLAWVYSTDFPVRIATTPAVSITGLTFARNELPPAGDITKGTYESAIYAGPSPGNAADRQAFPAQSLSILRRWKGSRMPIPAMLLGYSGERGNSTAEVLDCIDRGVASDGSQPTGTVYFVTSDDVRSRCRAWQFPDAASELALAGVTAVVTRQVPTGKSPLIGLMMGAANPKPGTYGRHLPGSFAEHLTSFAARFDVDIQTKLTAWIKAGATASAGTIDEPLSIWTKFPNARIYPHLASGCTMIESIYQSVRCPMQLLVVGEPLAAPWAPRGSVALPDLPETLSGVISLPAPAVKSPKGITWKHSYLVDGQPVPGTKRLDTTKLRNGLHNLRVIAYSDGAVRHQFFDEQTVTVRNGD